LQELECDLEMKAFSDYQANKEAIKNCARCNVPPRHSYDSFGMPMHRLECPICHSHLEYAKKFEGVKNYWNALQDGTIGEYEKSVFCR
jgi:hypothetical protein